MFRPVFTGIIEMETIAKRFLPNMVIGAMAGFVIGFMGVPAGLELMAPAMGLHEGFSGVIGAALGAVCGGWVGKQGGAVARWCAGTTAVVGCLSFAVGFIGPIVLQPDNPQGPLLGIFYTGPLGAVAGAALGAVLGLVVRANRRDVARPDGQLASQAKEAGR